MISGYQNFYYNVTNMEHSINFFSALGLEVVHVDEYWASLKLGNLNLGLHHSEGKPIPKTPRDSHGQDCGGTLTFLSNNILDDRLIIEKAGGIILGETDAPWGHMLVFEDLDKNVLILMNPKY
jgi:hypothetical protein